MHLSIMAAGHAFTCSSTIENVTTKCDANESKCLKNSHLLLIDNDLTWEGDLESLKRFVDTELQINGRWSTPRGENIKFSNPELSLKWDIATNKKITVTKDNNEKELYTILRKYATSSKAPNEENKANTSKHVTTTNTEADDTPNEIVDNSQTCKQCCSYKQDLDNLISIINDVKKRQNEECEINAQNITKILALLEQNNKMATEISSLKTSIEEITEENTTIKHILDIKQHSWVKVETTQSKKKETVTTNPITCQNRFEVLSIEEQDQQERDQDGRVVKSERIYSQSKKNNDLNKQISTYRKEQGINF